MAREAIFIGYRREDTADVAGRVYDALASRFGRARIFKDVDNLRPGADFGDYIRSILPRCRAVLVLIGPNWLEARDDRGRRRLDDANDWVRVEIETALATSGLDVVPVLVNGARMPSAEELPASLHPLLRRHAATIRRDPDFHDDINRLTGALRESLRSGVVDLSSLGGGKWQAPQQQARAGGAGFAMGVLAAVALAAVGFGAWRFWPHGSEAAPPVMSIAGDWVGEGQSCDYKFSITQNDRLLVVDGAQQTVTSADADTLRTAEGAWRRDGARLTFTPLGGEGQGFDQC